MFVEKDVSAPQPPAPESARFPHPDEDGRGPQGAQPAPGQGAPPPDGLIPPTREGRLRTRRDFQILYSHGTAVRGNLVVLIFRRNDQDVTRRAFIASKKVGGAVVRNRAKRLLRESFRLLRPDVNIDGMDVVLIARPPCATAGIHAVLDELAGLYKQAGRWLQQSPAAS